MSRTNYDFERSLVKAALQVHGAGVHVNAKRRPKSPFFLRRSGTVMIMPQGSDDAV